MYDGFCKEVLNPEYDPARLESFLDSMLNRHVKIVKVLPNDSTRITDESSLLVTDIIVELDDGSLANVEIQKIGYFFPGERCACYSADMLLRQYKRARNTYGDTFSYSQLKKVYLIVLYEKVPGNLRNFLTPIFIVPKQHSIPVWNWICYRNTYLSHLTFFVSVCTIKI